MTEPYDSVRRKVEQIFVELAGERAKTLKGSTFPAAIASALTAALSSKNAGEEEILQK